MKRASSLLAITVAALIILSQNGTQAVNRTFAERFAAVSATGESGTYNFDKAHSFIGFKVRHMGLIEVPGFFRDFTGAVNFDAKEISKSTVVFSAKATSVDTGVAPRDNDLRSANFFDVEKYPDITFKSTKVEKKDKNWMLTGDFTMKGVTKTISFPFQIVGWLPAGERSGGKMGIAAETTINRKDYGINYGSKLPSGVSSVSDEVTIVLQIEAGMKKVEKSAN